MIFHKWLLLENQPSAICTIVILAEFAAPQTTRSVSLLKTQYQWWAQYKENQTGILGSSGIIGQNFFYFTSTSLVDSENHIKKVNRNLESQQNDNIIRSVCETLVKKRKTSKNAKNQRNAIFIFLIFWNHRQKIFMLFHIYKYRRFSKSHQKSEPELGMPAERQHSKASLRNVGQKRKISKMPKINLVLYLFSWLRNHRQNQSKVCLLIKIFRIRGRF